jgi:hypothetical protein
VQKLHKRNLTIDAPYLEKFNIAKVGLDSAMEKGIYGTDMDTDSHTELL